MAKQRSDWTDILVRRGVIGPDQLKEAQGMKGVPPEDALVRLAYASPEQIMKAKAEEHKHGLTSTSARSRSRPAWSS